MSSRTVGRMPRRPDNRIDNLHRIIPERAVKVAHGEESLRLLPAPNLLRWYFRTVSDDR